MTPDDRRRAAQAALEFPLLMELFTDMEKQAVDACIHCPSTDHEKRLAHAVEARTIRNLLSRIRSLAEDKPETASRRVPA